MTKTYLKHGLAGALLCLTAASPAWADDLADYTRASARFGKLAGEKGRAAGIPDAAKVEMAALTATLSDQRRFLDARKFSGKDVDSVTTICAAAGDALATYSQFGLKDGLGKAAGNKFLELLKTNQVEKQNVVKYQKEMTALTAFTIKCTGRALPAISELVASLGDKNKDAMREPLAGMRGEATNYFTLLSAISTDASFTLESREKLFTVMAEVAPAYVNVLDVATRKRLVDQVGSRMAKVPPQLQPLYTQISGALKDTRCDAICRL